MAGRATGLRLTRATFKQVLLHCFVVLVLVSIAFVGLTEIRPAARAASGAAYYIDSASGSDSNPGISSTAPWKTLAPVQARTLAPGDTVYLRAGSEWDGGLVIASSGVEGKPITFTTYGSGARPIIRNTTGGEWGRAVSINASWIVLEGILVRDAHEFGVSIEQGAHHNVVRNCEATAVGIGFGVAGQYNLITGNLSHDLLMVHSDDGGDDDYGALAVCLYDSYNEVAYNRMLNCSAPSPDYGTDGGAVELYGDIVGSYIHHNWACSGSGFIEIGGGSAVDTVIAYNVSVDNGMFACVHLDGTFGSSVSNLRIENNTVVETPDGGGWAILAFVGAAPNASTLTLRNNIIYVGDYQLVSNADGFTHSNNLYYLSSASTQLGFQLGPQERIADPLFVDRAAGDFKLQPASPAIDAGLNLGYGLDFDGEILFGGVAPDLGAYEYTQLQTPAGTAGTARAYLPMLVSSATS